MTQLVKYSIEKYTDYLSDESRLKGNADSISFPCSADEVCGQIKELSQAGIPVTIQGARTGISGAAVPVCGHIINMSRFNRIIGMTCDSEGSFYLKVEPGVILSDLNSRLNMRSFDTTQWSEESREALKKLRTNKKRMLFPPNPTEKSATVGGMFSCNSKGINSLTYGAAANHVHAIDVCIPNGELWTIERGRYVFDDKGCDLPNGKRIEVCNAKPSSVYGSMNPHPGLDLIDLFAGAEGMIGAVLSLSLKLCPMGENTWGIMFFLKDWQSADQFAASIMKQKFTGVLLGALEFFDSEALRLVDEMKRKSNNLRSIPDFPKETNAAVYVELEGDDEEAIEEAMLSLMVLYDISGGEENNTWASSYEKDLEMFRLMRHAVPESVNTVAAESALNGFWSERVSLDCQLPVSVVHEMLCRYEADIEKSFVRGMVFGHYGDGRLHLELLPKNETEYSRARELVMAWSENAVSCGGTPAGENGIGKIKKYINAFADSDSVSVAKKVKNYFDPQFLFNPGNFST